MVDIFKTSKICRKKNNSIIILSRFPHILREYNVKFNTLTVISGHNCFSSLIYFNVFFLR